MKVSDKVRVINDKSHYGQQVGAITMVGLTGRVRLKMKGERDKEYKYMWFNPSEVELVDQAVSE